MMDFTSQQFDSYRLIRRLGVGGFASVYLGQHVRLTSNAIKRLSMPWNRPFASIPTWLSRTKTRATLSKSLADNEKLIWLMLKHGSSATSPNLHQHSLIH